MIFIIICLYILCPLIGILLTGILYFIDSKKKGIVYSIILASIFGILAYYFIPLPGYDLVRDHNIIKTIINNPSISFLIELYKNTEIEINRLIISYLVALTKNVDLLQFFIVFTGYFMIFYMLYDYKKNSKINNLTFLIITINIISGFYTKYFFSGLFNLFAIITFSFACYLDIIKQKKQIITIPIYIVSLLFHNSMFYAFLILMIFKISKKELSKKNILLILAITIFPYIFFNILKGVNVKIIKDLSNMYFSYVSKNDQKKVYYDGVLYIIEMSKIIFTLILAFILKKKKTNEKMTNFIILFSIGTLILMFQSRVMIRFANLIQFSGIPLVIDSFSLNNRTKKILSIVYIMLTILYILYFIYTITSLDYGNLFKEKIFENIYGIYNK